MLRQILQAKILTNNAFSLTNVAIKSLSSKSNIAASTEKWDLYAGVLVERLPVITKELNPRELKFQEYLLRVEFENSLKSNHELKHERDIKQAELIKKGKAEVDLDDASSKQTAQDLKDAYVEELKQFQPAMRTTADDVSSNLSTTNRCLDEVLYLLVEHKLGERRHMLLPQGPRQDGESMRQTAERVLREKCGDQIQVLFLSHAPCGFYKYKYPTDLRSSSIGAKVFFYRATLKAGNVDKKSANKFEWLTQSALDKSLDNSSYAKSVKKFLF